MIVPDIGISSNKCQLVTCYSPPNESLPLNVFNDILRRNSNTIILEDLNAKHSSWSNTTDNQKGRVLFEWLNENHLQVINKFIPTLTRSKAVIDLILAPTSICSDSFSSLPTL